MQLKNSFTSGESLCKFAFINSFGLHILAMAIMLCDHIWACLLTQTMWLTYVGRMAFPIFAFMAAEGASRTQNPRKYLFRLLMFAIVSEMPFDYMHTGTWVYPYEQNVLFTFLLALSLIFAVEKVRKKGSMKLTILAWIGAFILGGLLSFVFFVNYNVVGVYTVFVFYIFRKRKWWCLLAQFICLYYLNVEILGGRMILLNLLGRKYEVVMQGFALFALIPIWLYNGKKGYDKPWFKYFCYAFYPLHQLVLGILQMM